MGEQCGQVLASDTRQRGPHSGCNQAMGIKEHKFGLMSGCKFGRERDELQT